MGKKFEKIVALVEPLFNNNYGPEYRCSVTLKDGTFLPCVVLVSKGSLVEYAKKRITEEKDGHGRIGGDDPFGQTISSFFASMNTVSEWDIREICESKNSVPKSLMSQIKGESIMSWTGWVFTMKDGCQFSFGTGGSRKFCNLPSGYCFEDVIEVIKHCQIDSTGAVVGIWEESLAGRGRPDPLFRECPYFICAVEGL